MGGLTFAEHLAEAQTHPAYWSHLASLEFVDQVCEQMDAQGVSSAELARRMGTSRAWVSKVLRGENNLTVASMGKLAFALGMRVTTELAPLDETADRRCRATVLSTEAAGPTPSLHHPAPAAAATGARDHRKAREAREHRR